jgi:spore germination cell wall hydrolase CwlJ-like protein
MTPIDATILAALFAMRLVGPDGEGTTALHLADPQEIKCLAKVVYHETRGRDMPEATAIAHATLARIGTPFGGNSVCEVIAKPKQYPWYAKRNKIDDMKAWKASVDAAALAYTDLVPAPFKATHFDVCGRNPQPWKHKLPKAGRVNQTCFWEAGK